MAARFYQNDLRQKPEKFSEKIPAGEAPDGDQKDLQEL